MLFEKLFKVRQVLESQILIGALVREEGSEAPGYFLTPRSLHPDARNDESRPRHSLIGRPYKYTKSTIWDFSSLRKSEKWMHHFKHQSPNQTSLNNN